MASLFLLAPLLVALQAEDEESQSSAPNEADEEPAGEVVVVEARLSADQAQTRTIDSEMVRRTGVTSLAEALERDVAVWGSYGARGERLISVRGFEQEQLAVFVDGVPTTVPYNGSLDLGKYPASIVGTARVAPGASAGLYGPTGLGGAVEIHTPGVPESAESSAWIRATPWGALEASGSAGGKRGPFGLRLAGGGASTPGFPLSSSFEPTDRERGGLRNDSDSRQSDAEGRFEWNLGRGGAISATSHVVTGNYGVPTGLEGYPPRYWRFTEFEDMGSSLAHHVEVGERLSLEEVGFATWNRNLLDAFDDATRSTQNSPGSYHSLYVDHRLGGTARADVLAGAPTAPLGIVRTRLFVDHQVHHAVPDIGEDAVDVATTVFSAAATAELLRKHLPHVFAGLEGDAEVPGQVSDFTPAPAFLGPVAGLRVGKGERVDIVASAARRARFPTLKERFSSARGYRIPNLDLGPEKAWHFGIDAAVRPHRSVDVTLSAYDAEVDDLIEEATTSSGQSQLRNVGQARFLGAEAIGHARLASSLDLEGAVGVLHARRVGEDPPQDRLAYRPAWQGLVGATWRPATHWEAWSSVTVTGPQYYFDEDNAHWGTLGSFFLLDASLFWQATPHGRLGIQTRNILDANEQSRWGYPDPGRQIFFSVEVKG